MKEKKARAKFHQMGSPVQYYQQNFIDQKDLKAENPFLDADVNIKMLAFVFSNKVAFGKKLVAYCGNPPFAVAELLKDKNVKSCYIHRSAESTFRWTESQRAMETGIEGTESLQKKFLILHPSMSGQVMKLMRECGS